MRKNRHSPTYEFLSSLAIPFRKASPLPGYRYDSGRYSIAVCIGKEVLHVPVLSSPQATLRNARSLVFAKRNP